MSTITNIPDDELDRIAEYAAGLSKIFGFLDETKHKYFVIRRDFRNMRKMNKTIDDVELFLGEKYCISKERIHQIVYNRKIKEG